MIQSLWISTHSPLYDERRPMRLEKSRVVQYAISSTFNEQWPERQRFSELVGRLGTKIGIRFYNSIIPNVLNAYLVGLALKYECFAIKIDDNEVSCYPHIKEFEEYFNNNEPIPLDEFAMWTSLLNLVGGHPFQIYTPIGYYHYRLTKQHPPFITRTFEKSIMDRKVQILLRELDISDRIIYEFATDEQISLMLKLVGRLCSKAMIWMVITAMSFDQEMKLYFGPKTHLSFGFDDDEQKLIEELDRFRYDPDRILHRAAIAYYLLTKEEISYDRIRQLLDYYYKIFYTPIAQAYLEVLADVFVCIFLQDIQNQEMLSAPFWLFFRDGSKRCG